MKPRNAISIAFTLLSVGCAQMPVAVPVACPSLPPIPDVLTLRASTELSLIKQLESIDSEFLKSLERAQRTP